MTPWNWPTPKTVYLTTLSYTPPGLWWHFKGFLISSMGAIVFLIFLKKNQFHVKLKISHPKRQFLRVSSHYEVSLDRRKLWPRSWNGSHLGCHLKSLKNQNARGATEVHPADSENGLWAAQNHQENLHVYFQVKSHFCRTSKRMRTRRTKKSMHFHRLDLRVLSYKM